MSVTIKWNGRTGNQLFSYCFARVLAAKNNLRLVTEWPHQDFIETTPHEAGEEHDEPVVTIKDLYWNDHDRDWLNQDFKRKRVYVDGFFQNPKYYDPNKQLVKSFFNLPEINKRPSNEIVLHWRLSDYYQVGPGKQGSVIRADWYAHVLMHKIRFNPKINKLFIVTDDPSDRILHKLQRFHPTIVSENPKHDFNFIREFDTIICGNSTFSWMAAFLSDASKIFTFSKWINEPHRYIIRLALMRGATPVQGNWV